MEKQDKGVDDTKTKLIVLKGNYTNQTEKIMNQNKLKHVVVSFPDNR